MKTSPILLALFALTAFLGCTREILIVDEFSSGKAAEAEQQEETAYDGPVFKAGQEGLKSYLNASLETGWEWGDALGVTTSSDNNVCCQLVNKENGLFRADKITGSQPYYVVFPYSSDNTFNTATNTLTATVPAMQILASASQRVAPDAMVATCKCTDESREFSLKHCVSLLSITIHRDDISQISVTSTGAPIAGRFSTVVTANPMVITPIEGSNTVTLKAFDFAKGGAFVGDATYYIALLPGTTSSLTITFTNTEGKTAIVTRTASDAFDRNGGLDIGGFFAYSIGSVTDLKNFSAKAHRYTYWDTVNLTADINMTGESYTQINNFLGTFHGGSHTISGLTKPLFGNLYGSVDHLTVESNITSISGLNGTDYGIGILAHYLYENSNLAASKGTGHIGHDNVISDVTTRGSISVSSVSKGHTYFVGGLAGSSRQVALSGCKNYASVTLNGLTFSRTEGGDACRVAGVVGQLAVGAQNYSNCENYGAVRFTGTHAVTGTDSNCYVSVGGVFAHSVYNSTIFGCTNEGSVTADFSTTSGGYLCVGGVVASCAKEATITSCVNGSSSDASKGAISAAITKNTGAHDATDFMDCGVGGIVGSLDGSAYGAVLTLCDNYGDVSDAVNTQGYCVAGSGSRHFVGGIVGRFYGMDPSDKANPDVVLTQCANSGDLECAAPVADTLHMGGVAGKAVAYAKLDRCTSGGSVTVTNALTSDVTYLTMSGCLGYAEKGVRMVSCSNTGEIVNNAAPGGTKKWVNQLTVGGILAYTGQYSRLTSCTNGGDISLTSASRWNYFGGVVGHTLHGAYLDGCSNSGDLSTTGNVSGDYFRVGGVAGNFACSADATDADAPKAVPYGTITGCTNTGTVTVSTKGASNHFPYIGGVLGGSTSGATYLLSSRSEGSVAVTVSSGTMKDLQLGGLAGYMGNANGKIDACKVHSDVSRSGTVTTLHVAEILGYCGTGGTFTITNCYVGGSVNGTDLTSENWTSYRANKASGSFTLSGNKFWSTWPD